MTITEFLPDDRPLTVAALRVLPAGLLLVGIGIARSGWRPRGHEWLQHGLIALFNFGLFFPLLVVATYRLPGGVVGAAGGLQPLLVATLSFAVAIVPTKRFPPAEDRIAATGWQLLLSSILLAPIAVIVEGTPPTLGPSELAAFAYLSLATTVVAFVLWFTGIERLPTPAPPLLGLAAPLTGAAVGWVALGQSFNLIQILGFGVTITAITLGVRPHQGSVSLISPPRGRAARRGRVGGSGRVCEAEGGRPRSRQTRRTTPLER